MLDSKAVGPRISMNNKFLVSLIRKSKKNLTQTNFFLIILVEHKLWKSEANRKAQEAIAEDPENTICERAWWIFKGWTIKCSRAPFQGFDCGTGVHDVLWSKEKYDDSHRKAFNHVATDELD